MSARTFTMKFGRLFPVLGSLLAADMSAAGYSIVFPKFSAPIFQDNRLIFTSPDAKRLLCAELDGKIAWEQKFDFPIRLFTGREAEALVQTGMVVSCVSPKSGQWSAKFSVESTNDGVSFSSEVGSYVSRDLRFEKRMFKLLEGNTGKALWRSAEIENVICATPDSIVCLAAKRIPTGRGYSFGSASLDAYERGTFARRWSVPLAKGTLPPSIPAAFKAPYLVYAEGETMFSTALTVLDSTTGTKRLSKKMEVPEYGWIGDVKVHEEHVVWLTHKMNRLDMNNTEYFLHFCTIPELNEEKVVTLKLIEIARVSFEGGFIISDALYRTACFRPDGKKVWERFQTARASVINGRIYFSDYSNKKARLGFVDVPTGKETVLYSEPVEEPKK